MKLKLLPATLWVTLSMILISQPADASSFRYGVSNVWAPVRRPEQLALPNWNAPVTGIPPVVVPPDPEGSGPISVSLTDPITGQQLLSASPDLEAAFGAANSEVSIGNEFFGLIGLRINNLSLGQSVLLEKFRLDNDQGMINSNAVLQESHRLTDGITTYLGTTNNWNQPGDRSERDGTIETELLFLEPAAESIPGEYAYRVSSPGTAFAPAIVRLTVFNQPTAQGFTGTVTAGGQPLEGAIVALLNPLTGSADFLKGVFTGADGGYSLDAPSADGFDIVALKPGYVGPFTLNTGVLVGPHETVVRNLQLEPGTRTISGLLMDDGGNPLPGVEMVFISLDDNNSFDNRLCALVWTDDQGLYSVRVTPDRWGAMVRVDTAAKIGCVTSSLRPLSVADARTEDVANTTNILPRAKSLIWGYLNSDGLVDIAEGGALPLGGVEILALNHETGEAAWTVSNPVGEYRLAVTPGHWDVFPFTFSLEEAAHSGSVTRNLTLTATNQSLRHDFYVRPAGGFNHVSGYVEWLENPDVRSANGALGGALVGRFRDEAGNPVDRMRLLAFNTDLDILEASVQATFEIDGYYSFLLPDGEWLIYPDPEQAVDRNLLFRDLPRVTISQINELVQHDVTALTPTATIELTVTDSTSQPLSNLLVHAFATIGGRSHDSFGRTDANGVARLPAVPGLWILHVKAESAGALGKKELPLTGVQVTGSMATATLQAEDYSNAAPMLSLARRENGAFKFSGVGDSGRYYAIEASTNLVNWYEIGRARAVSNAFDLLDQSSGRERLFYRAVQK